MIDFERVSAAARRPMAAAARHARLLGDPESMVAAFIATVWSVLAGLEGGTVGLMVTLSIGWLLHAAAVESGSHVALWLATSGLLILAVIGSSTTLDGLPPVLLAAAGATVLAHNELIRLNYTRRRRAEVDPEVFRASGLAVTAAGILGVIGVAIVEMTAGDGPGGGRSWVWMPVATGALLAIGYGLSLLAPRRAPDASQTRWRPGERLPPPPSAAERRSEW